MNRRYSVDPMNRSLDARKPLVDVVLEYLGAGTLIFLGVLFLAWVAGGFQ